jgi:hypothetical protein
MAEEMLAITIPESSNRLDKVLQAAFPLRTDASDLQKRNHDETITLVRSIYNNDKNMQAVGANGWAAYNAVVEYLDHFRPGTPEERALTVLDDTSWVVKTKIAAQQAVLALV